MNRELRFETLENRCMLAGMVTAWIDGNDLKVTGDNSANMIEIVDNGQGVKVRGVATRINYSLNFEKSFPQVTGDLIIKMKGGADTVIVSDVGNGSHTEFLGGQYEVLGRIVIAGGRGQDNILVNSPNDVLPKIRGLSIFGGPADDCVKVIGVDIDNVAAKNDLLIRLAGGNDTLVIDSEGTGAFASHVFGDTLIDASVGDDQIRLSYLGLGTQTVTLGAGDDWLGVTDSQFQNFQAYGGAGRDVIGTIESGFFNDVYVAGAGGRDRIIANASTFGTVGTDQIKILGGKAGDWFAARHTDFVGNTYAAGGPGIDNLALIEDVTFGGRTSGFEDHDPPPPGFDALINDLLGIDCDISL